MGLTVDGQGFFVYLHIVLTTTLLNQTQETMLLLSPSNKYNKQINFFLIYLFQYWTILITWIGLMNIRGDNLT